MSSNPLFDMSPYQSKASTSYTTDWRDATYSDPAWEQPQLHPGLENNTTEADGNAESNSTPAPTMIENETTDSTPTPVEVVEELSQEEAADRQRLELLVERAFSQAGSGLCQLRDRRLYRSTHKTF